MAGTPPAGSYNISAALRALGIRDPRVIPTLGGGQILPVISFGEFETFVPEVIEGRGIQTWFIVGPGANRYRELKMLSVAPGGTIIESLVLGVQGVADSSVYLITSLTEPSPGIGTAVSPWVVGGQSLSNLWIDSGQLVTPKPNFPPGTSSGVTFQLPFAPLAEPENFARVWVPAGSWFTVTFDRNTATLLQILLRFREIPQAQGAA